jgi:hypothetical protein
MSAFVNSKVVNIPSCATKVSAADYDATRAALFDPRDPSYYKDLVPSAIGGFVLGSLCVVGALLLAAWLVSARLRKHTWRHELQQLESVEKGSGNRVNVQLGGGAVQVDADGSSGGWKGGADGGSDDGGDSTALQAWPATALLVLAAVAAAACIWALAESVLSTNSSAARFWDVIEDAKQQLDSVLATSQALLQATKDIRSAFLVLWWRTTAGKASLPAGMPANASALLQQSARQFEPIILAAEQSSARIQANGVEALQAFEDQFKGSMLRAQDFEVPVVMSLFYGLLACGCAAGGWLGLRGRRPQTLGWLTVALWLLSALLLLFGAGVLNGGRTVTDDTCLYAEALALNAVTEQASPELQQQLRLGLRYYFGVAPLPIHLVAGLVYGMDFDSIRATLQTPDIKNVTTFLLSRAGERAVESGKFNATGQRLVAALPANLDSLDTKVDRLADEINLETFRPLYQRAKEVLCCEWRDDVHGLFAAWTATGVVVLVLCAALSYRVYCLAVRPGQRANPVTRLWQELAHTRRRPGRGGVFGAQHPMRAQV